MTTAIVTLAAKYHGFIQGAIVQLRAVKQLITDDISNIILVEKGHYAEDTITNLKQEGYTVQMIEPLRPTRQVKYVASRWAYTFNKFYLWQLNYDNIIYLDADCLPIEDNFHRRMLQDKGLAACSVRTNTPTRFNAGVMALQPDSNVFQDLIKILDTTAEGAELADQGLLNIYFKSFNRLPDVYNMRYFSKGCNPRIAHLRPPPWTGARGNIHARPFYTKWHEYNK